MTAIHFHPVIFAQAHLQLPGLASVTQGGIDMAACCFLCFDFNRGCIVFSGKPGQGDSHQNNPCQCEQKCGAW